jgi:hypothetical protein
MLGNLNLANNKITNLAAGTATTDAATWAQLFGASTQADIASAATTDIGIKNTSFLRVTGTTTITSFGSNYRGPRFLTFAGAVTLTNSSTLVLPGNANITTAAGDSLIVIPGATSGTADKWVVMAYQKNAVPGTATIPDGSITAAKLADTAAVKLTLDQTIAGVKTFSSSPVVPDATTSGQAVNKGQLDAVASQSGITSATAVTASGTSVDFTSIPTGVKRITVMFNGVSTNGTSLIQIQLGTSGGFVTSGYTGGATFAAANGTNATGLLIDYSTGPNAGTVRTGCVAVNNMTGNTWISFGSVSYNANTAVNSGGVALSGALDRIRITTVNGTDTFDAGTINILMEG